MLRGFGIAGLALAASIVAAAAQEMKSPRISSTQVDWDAAVLELTSIDSRQHADVPAAMAELNRATGERFANIAASPVPVLLPFDTAAFLRDRADSGQCGRRGRRDGSTAPADYLSGFSAVPFFYPGPAGYDAVVMARAQDMGELAIGFADPIYIHIGGSALVYELDEPVGMIGWPVHGLEDIPGIRRLYLENYVRYTFVRYGVPYVVAIECSDGGLRFRKDVLPRCRQGRGALPQGLAPRRRHAADAAGRGRRRHHRSAAGTVRGLHLSQPRRHHSRHRLPAQRRRGGLHRLFQDPFSDCRRRRPSPIPSPS